MSIGVAEKILAELETICQSSGRSETWQEGTFGQEKAFAKFKKRMFSVE